MNGQYRQNGMNKNHSWFEEKVFCGLTKNDLSLIVVTVILAGVYLTMNWDWIFGRR